MRSPFSDVHRLCIMMRALVLTVALWGIMPTSALGGARNEVRLLRSEPDGVTIEVVTKAYTLSRFNIGEELLTVVSAPGYGMTETPGLPQLPVTGVLIGVPSEGALSADVLETRVSTVTDLIIAPVPAIPGNGANRMPEMDVPRVLDRSFYTSGPAYPERLVEVTRLGLFRDVPTAGIMVHPFVYHPVTRELHIYERLLVHIRFLTGQRVTRPIASIPRLPGLFDRTVTSSLLNGADAGPWRVSPPQTPLRKSTMVGAITGPRCRIRIKMDGLYRVTRAQLVEAGFDVREINPRRFSMTNKGQPVAILVDGGDDGSFDDGDAVEFYGIGQRQTFQAQFPDMYQDPYTDENIYWLSWGGAPGPRLAKESGSIVQTDPTQYLAPSWYESSVHAEQDLEFDRLGGSLEPMSDHWLWDDINAGQSRSYSLILPASFPGVDSPTTLRGMFHGRTDTPSSPDHHIVITALDRALTADARWDGITRHMAVDSRLAATAQLRDTVNVTLTAPGDTPAGEVDFIRLNWLEIDYPRAYRAVDDQIVFTKPHHSPLGLYQFTIDGFNTPAIQVYKIGVSQLINLTVEPVVSRQDGERYRVTLQTQVLDPDTRFIALTPDRKLVPSAIQRVDPEPVLTAPAMGADYVIITHDDFYEAVQRLADYRRRRGLMVETVKVSAIYDQFNDGILSPDAIQQFLRYTYAHWSPAPSYVLLVGDGRIDYRGKEATGNFVPVHLIQTVAFGAVGSDHRYTLVSGDDLLPDLAIGRFPVRTVDELNVIIDKTIAYESTPEWGSWRRTLFFLSGDQRPEFEWGSESLIQQFVPDSYVVSRLSLLYTHVTGDSDFDTVSKQQLVTQLNDGVALFNFIGHGGGGTWADRNVWEYEDVSRMTNAGRLPVIISMTCFTGSFDSEVDGLGERFLKTPGRGAIAFFGSTGAGWLYNDFYINQALFQSLFKQGTREIGRVFAEAKASYLGVYGKGLSGSLARSQVFQYILLGDPALSIGFPPSTVTLHTTPSAVFPREPIHVDGAVQGSTGGTVDLALYRRPDASSDESVLSVTAVPVRTGVFATDMTIPEGMPAGDAVVKAYHHSDQDQHDGQGAAKIAIGNAYIGNVSHVPAAPGASDSVKVFADVTDRNGVATVICAWSSGNNEVQQIPMVQTSTAGRYHTQRPIPAMRAGTEITYTISALNGAGGTIASSAAAYRVRFPIDLMISPSEIQLTGSHSVQVTARVHNIGETDAASVAVRAFVNLSHEDQQIGSDQTVPLIAAGGSAVATWTTPLPAGTPRISVMIDPDARLDEPNRGNNRVTKAVEVTRFNITPEVGLTFDGATTAWATSPDGQCVFSAPPGFVSRPAVLAVATESMSPVAGQPDIVPAPLMNAGRAYRLALADSTDRPAGTRPLTVGIRYDASNPVIAGERDHLAIYRWAPEIGRWILLGGTVDSTAVTVESANTGLFGLFVNHDRTPPTIQTVAGDHPLVDGGYVPANATLSAVVQDANGVDTVERRIEIVLDGIPVDSTQVIYRGNRLNANAVPVLYTLSSLEPGMHTVVFRAADCNGNYAMSTITRLAIASDLNIRQVGNYPNPMRGYTVFTYTLTNPVDELTLRVYTVDGRSVRTFSTRDATASGAIDYHEIIWDGTDDGGRPVANGVYFYRLTARMGDQSVNRTMKLAVLR